MPDLPILSLSDEHFALVVAVFPGNTAEEKAASYLNWLINGLIDVVEGAAVHDIEEEVEAIRVQRFVQLNATLPPRPPRPVFGG